MPKSFPVRPGPVALISFFTVFCLIASAEAQHGGGFGGGHFGGGHFGGGHSSQAHASGGHAGVGHHFAWLHFRSRSRSGRNAEDILNAGSTDMAGIRSQPRIPSTYIETVPLRSLTSSPHERFSTYSRFRHAPDYFYGGFRRFHGSGCFFNGFNQICFFEPAWPLLWFSGGFGWYPLDWGSGGNSDADTTDELGSTDTMTAPAPDAEVPVNAGNQASSAQEIRGQDLDPRFFLLILKNGTDHVATDYWFSEGYIEYVSRDGSRSQIPVDALDLEETVRNNAARGLSFVLRSAP